MSGSAREWKGGEFRYVPIFCLGSGETLVYTWEVVNNCLCMISGFFICSLTSSSAVKLFLSQFMSFLTLIFLFPCPSGVWEEDWVSSCVALSCLLGLACKNIRALHENNSRRYPFSGQHFSCVFKTHEIMELKCVLCTFWGSKFCAMKPLQAGNIVQVQRFPRSSGDCCEGRQQHWIPPVLGLSSLSFSSWWCWLTRQPLNCIDLDRASVKRDEDC